MTVCDCQACTLQCPGTGQIGYPGFPCVEQTRDRKRETYQALIDRVGRK